MGRPHDVASLLREGLCPAEMAKRLGISVGSVGQYLWVAVGEGLIRPSDVLFSLPKTLRKEAGTIIRQNKPKTVSDLQRELYRRGVGYDREELQMLWNLMGAGTIHHHLYEFIVNTEKVMHDKIRETLREKFGDKESGWWRQGVPEAIRLDCVKAREQGEDEAEPYEFTTFIHLSEIIDKHWPLFVLRLPNEVISDKKEFLGQLKTLNGIRNRVMHPTRLHKISDEDFEFAREVHRKLRLEAWR